MDGPHIAVISSLFPSALRPMAGVFIRERMFRVARFLPLTVVSPQPWFPALALIRRVKPGYRPPAERYERQQRIDVHRPRFLAAPGIGRSLDALAMALGAAGQIRRLRDSGRCDVLDAHFAYPDGCAACWIGRWLRRPVTITMRGTEPRYLADAVIRPQVEAAFRRATMVFTVCDSLRQLALAHGCPPDRVTVVGNGVDTKVFKPLARDEARRALDIEADAKVLVTVGGLVERKGFHRVIEQLPVLVRRYPRLLYVIVGGASAEGDWRERLARMAEDLGVRGHVRFLGPRAPEELKVPLSAADVFVLASSNEGWANVILEAMACGIPVVASDVGGNAEVVRDETLGLIYPYGEPGGLQAALDQALAQRWDRDALIGYAERNGWEHRVSTLVEAFRNIIRDSSSSTAPPPRSPAPS